MQDVTLIISTYNRIPELELVLNALLHQTDKDFSVIIAEDGGSENVRNFTENLKNLPFDVSHITQADSGFRKNAILNKAVQNTGSKQLIFIDGDCVPHSRFIEQHKLNFKTGSVTCGRRVALGKKLSKTITAESIESGEYEKIGLKHFLDSLKRTPDSSKHIEEGLLLSGFFEKELRSSKVHILGCNFSIDRSLLLKVNGFDENYTGPGIGEDVDLEFRLRLIGAKFISVKNKAIVFHLYHTKTKEDKKNVKYFNEVKRKQEFYCRNGLVKVDS